MSSDLLIRLRGVGKAYPVFDKPYERLLHLLFPRRATGTDFHALHDINLDIRRGEAIGVIGRNGSGKSTLLQVITGILQPSTGTVEVRGRIAALLELGAGFNPEFTGRENIRLNAGLLGLTGEEIDERMDRIVAFAEIGEHVEQQVKTYSSGMFMRLAFAVAVHTDPEVLIVDEALSVGDVYFQRKCFRRIEELRQQGCTLLFVTHSIDSVIQLCDRGIVLDSGHLVYDGEARAATTEYLKRVFGENAVAAPSDAEVLRQEEEADDVADEMSAFLAGGREDRFRLRPGYNRDETRLGNGRATTCDFLVVGGHGYGPLVTAREPFRILVRYWLPEAMDRLMFGLRICQVTGVAVYSSNTLVSSGRLYACEAGTVAIAEFDLRCALLRGQYFVTVGVSRLEEDGVEIQAIDRRSDAIILGVSGPLEHAEGTADLEARFTLTGRTGAIHELP